MNSTRTRRRWWRRERPRMSAEGAPDGAGSPGSVTQLTARSPRMEQAEAEVRRWVAELRGGFDAGSGNYFDRKLDGREIDWHEQDDREHESYLSDLGRRIADARRDITYTEGAIEKAEEDLARAERNYELARARLSGEPRQQEQPSPDRTHLPARAQAGQPGTHPPTTGGPNYREPHLLSGKSIIDLVSWLFVLLAVVGDFTVFYALLARLLRTAPTLVVAGAVGFTAGTIGICHLVGNGLQRRRSGDRRRSDGLLWVSVLAWLALGAFAFFVRLRYGVQGSGIPTNPGSSSFGGAPARSTDPDLLPALFFAGLYLVSGLVAMAASFYAFNPAFRAYKRAIRQLNDAAENLNNTKARLAEQQVRLDVLKEELSRAGERRQRASHRTETQVARLKILVRHLMAAELKDPRAFDLLMRDAPEINKHFEWGHRS